MTSQLVERPGLLERPASRTGELTVEVRDGAKVVSRQTLSGHAIIGRASDAQIRLDRGTVSRQHAEVLSDPFGRWWIRDTGSRNGLILGGRRVQERAIRDGDQFQVGDFLVTFHLPGGDESDTTNQGGTQTTIVPVSDMDSPAGISTAQELGTPRLAASHLSMLLEMGRELMGAEVAEGRMVQLCQLMLRPEFKGTCAMALRVLPGKLESPAMLCPVQSLGGHGGRPPVSRSLLRTALERNAPAMAGNQMAVDAGGPEMIEMSMMASLRPMCAVACPLRSPAAPGGPTDLLYVIFPPECATGEWLAITALAAEQYRLAESAWAARHEAMRHVAVERDLEQARHIQLRLVPRDLSVPGLEVAVGFEPCRWVGGDYTDAAVLPDGRVFLAVADVCGKGLGAALVSSSLHTLVRSMVLDDERVCLKRLMTRLNRHMSSYLDSGQFVTMACVLVDPKTGEVEAVNAGHPPVVVIDGKGETRELSCGDNLPVGVEEEPIFLCTDRLEPGQLLAMYTDGLTEARVASGEMIGIVSLRRELGAIHASCGGTPLGNARARVTTWLDTVSGGRMQDDDRTFLLARRMAAGT